MGAYQQMIGLLQRNGIITRSYITEQQLLVILEMLLAETGKSNVKKEQQHL